MTDHKLLLSTCLLAGRIMMESGSEAYRIEDTMQRIALNTGNTQTESYVTATGIFVSLNSEGISELTQARNRSINLEKIDATNQLSRRYANGEFSLSELKAKLEQVDQQTPEFNRSYRVLSAGIASAALMIILGGHYSDFLFAFLIGGLGYWISSKVFSIFKVKFINDLLASLVISLLSVLLSQMGLTQNLDSLIVGCIMPLVPGLAITSAMRDLFESHLITGSIRAVEALLTAIVIGVGIVMVLRWL